MEADNNLVGRQRFKVDFSPVFFFSKEFNVALFQEIQEIHVNVLYSYWPENQINCVKLTSIDSTCLISSPNSMLDHLLESSRWDNSNKWSNIEIGEEIGILEIEICTLSGALISSLDCIHVYYLFWEICLRIVKDLYLVCLLFQNWKYMNNFIRRDQK